MDGRRWIIWAVVAVIVIGGGIWLVQYLTTPAPGVAVADMGREHVSPEKVAETSYNSNPPTSGPHLETWVKPGIYQTPQSEGELIHSLEHGYVIISYNCNASSTSLLPFVGQVHAQEGSVLGDSGESATPSSEASSGTLELPAESTQSATNETDACKTLVSEIEELARRKRLFKLIVVPRPQLETKIALTAWAHRENLTAFDAGRMERFIDYYRDHGPEQTME